MIELRQLRHFLAVADTLHFGRAAEQLGMTQPPLSQSIIALERQLGAALFRRDKRNVVLTDFGKQWLEHVRPVVKSVADLTEIARRLRDGNAGQLALSFVSTADYSLLPALVQQYTARYPAVEISLTEATSDIQIAALVNGSSHAGIIIPPDEPLPNDLAYMPLLREPLVVALPENWGNIAESDLSDKPVILFPRRVAPVFYDLVMGYLSRSGGPVHIRQEAIQMQTIISLVSAGMGIALVPASLRNLARSGVVYMDLSNPPILETGLTWRKAEDRPTLTRLLDVARSLRLVHQS